MRARYEENGASGPRCRYVQAIEAVQELHATRCVLGTRRRHGIYDDGRFLALELVHRSDADLSAHQSFGKPADVRVIGCDDQNVFIRHLRGVALLVNPLSAWRGKLRDKIGDNFDLFGRRVPIAVVVHIDNPQAAASELADASEALALEPGLRREPALVKQLGRERTDARCQPPRDRKKDAAVGWNRQVFT